MKERIITAICLLAVVIPVVYLGGYWFRGLMFIAVGMAAWEMMVMHNQLVKVSIGLKVLTLFATLGAVFIDDFFIQGFILSSYYSVLLICFILKKIELKTVAFYANILVYIGLSFLSLLAIRTHSLTLFIFLIATVSLTDSMAYFVGRCFGKHKLAPKISPKKTVEGAMGGWLAGASFAVVFGLMNHLFTQRWVLVVLATGLPILSQIGDLLASALKRRYGIKDYGKIFPGHGGVMDRVDSQLLAAVLIYVIIQIGGVTS